MVFMIKIPKKNFLNIFLILISITLFVIGFILNEDSAGGGAIDFNNTWNNQKVFDQNSIIDSLENTKSSRILAYKNSHFPTSYILNKFLNPFSIDKEKFRISIFVLNLFLPLIFLISLKNIFKNIDVSLLAAYSSIIYLSPYFRTSAYWASLENYGLYCLIISIYFFSKYKVYLLNKENLKNKNIFIILLSFFSCISVYFDQKLLFVPIIYFFYVLKFEKNNISKFVYLISNFLLSLPVVGLILYWGTIIPPHTSNTRDVGNLYLEQVGYSFSIIFFYLIPYMIINYKKIILDFNYKKNKNIILFSIIFLLFMLIIDHDYGGWEIYGKGWLHKFSNLIFENQNYRKIFTYIIFLITMILSIKILIRQKILIFFVLFMCLISIFSNPIFQEYFDPLVFIILSCFFYKKNELNNKLVNTIYFYNLIFLVFANIYYF